MKVNIYAVYDSAAKAYGRPIFLQADGLVMRAFKDMVNDPRKETDISKHPEQFTLFKIAEYDDQHGVIVPLETLKLMASGHEMVDLYEPAITEAEEPVIIQEIVK
jgi:hypothetical protein